MLPKGARSFEVTANLAVGKEKAKCWRNEVYAEERAHPLLPLGRLANLLDTKFVWENGETIMQCQDKDRWRTMTKFEIRNNMAYTSQLQFEVLRRTLWVQQAEPQTIFDWAILAKNGTRSKDDSISQSWCESEDVWDYSICQYSGSTVRCCPCSYWTGLWLCSKTRTILTTQVGLSRGDVHSIQYWWDQETDCQGLLEHISRVATLKYLVTMQLHSTWSGMDQRQHGELVTSVSRHYGYIRCPGEEFDSHINLLLRCQQIA